MGNYPSKCGITIIVSPEKGPPNPNLKSRVMYICENSEIELFRSLVTILFLLIFTLQLFQKQCVLLDYYANQTAYARNCINRSKPRMHCNGKCQVMKKMQQEEQEQKQDANKKPDFNKEGFSPKSFFPGISGVKCDGLSEYGIYIVASLAGYADPILRLPGR
jgi:hypothetical protein